MARPKFSLGIAQSVRSMTVTLAGMAAVAFGSATFKVALPSRAKVVGVSFNAGAKGGTHSTSTIDVKNGSTSLLASTIDVAAAVAGTPVERNGTTMSTAADDIAQGTAISIVCAESGGTSPTLTAATLTIEYVPLGD